MSKGQQTLRMGMEGEKRGIQKMSKGSNAKVIEVRGLLPPQILFPKI